MGGDLYALDFDGVLCDSCGESSLSAVKVTPRASSSFRPVSWMGPSVRALMMAALVRQAAKVRWPWVFEQVDAAMEEWIVEQMYTVSPFWFPAQPRLQF